jgi:hypothetical protein
MRKYNSPIRKPRAGAVLKTMPEERQREIVEYARNHTLVQTSEWLEASGVKASISMISQFLTWFANWDRVMRIGGKADALRERLRKERGWTPEQLDRVGQVFFTELAIDLEDAFCWKIAQDIRAQHKSLELEKRRVRILEREAGVAKAAETISNPALTEEEKQAEYRRILGTE